MCCHAVKFNESRMSAKVSFTLEKEKNGLDTQMKMALEIFAHA